VAPWGLLIAGRDRVGRAVDSSDTPFRNMCKTSGFSLQFQYYVPRMRELISRFYHH